MRLQRLLRHAAALHWRTRMLFPRTTLDAIRDAIVRAERAHAGEIRFAVETALPPRRIIGEVGPRGRALEVFSDLRVWDTEHNNGVLIYVLIADHSVEIVADRGLSARITSAEWEGGLPYDRRALSRRAHQGRLDCRDRCRGRSAGASFSGRDPQSGHRPQ